jgi:hypothetical protein
VGLVRPVRRDPTGRTGPTPGQARGPGWRKTGHGLYVPARITDESPEQRIVEQAARLPPGGAVTGWAGGRLFGAAFLDGLQPDGRTRLPVPLAIGPRGNIRADGAVTLSRDRLDPDEVCVRFGIPCTSRERGIFDAARWAPDLREAVVVIEMAAAGRVTSVRRLSRYVDGRAGWQGVGQVRNALALACEGSRSPNETRTHLIWRLDAGLPPALVNQPVFDLQGRLLGYPDLFDPEAGVVGEFEGGEHRGAARHTRDVGREDVFRRHGLEYFKVTGRDLDVPERIVDRMLTTRSRALWLERGQAWTLSPPSWWRPDPSLDELLDHRDWLDSLDEEAS